MLVRPFAFGHEVPEPLPVVQTIRFAASEVQIKILIVSITLILSQVKIRVVLLLIKCRYKVVFRQNLKLKI